MAWLSVEHFLLLTRAEKAVRRNGRMYFDRFWHSTPVSRRPEVRCGPKADSLSDP